MDAETRKRKNARYRDGRSTAWHRHWNLRKTYRMTEQDYQKLFDAQGGVCAVCSRPETATRAGKAMSLAIDHDHETGKVRGLLCGRCNTAIGLMSDSPEVLTKAAAYIAAHSKE